MLGCFWTSIFKSVIVDLASDDAYFVISLASMFWLLGKWPCMNSTQSFCVCLWKGSFMIMEATMLTWWIWTNWARENFPPFDCQTIFLDWLKVLNAQSDDPFYYLFPPPSYFICFFYEATKCYGDDQDQFPSDDISLRSTVAYGTMEQHAVGNTGCDASVAQGKCVGIDP